MDKDKQQTADLRVIIKDLGGLAKREDFLNQQIQVLVDTPDHITGLLTNRKSVEQKIRANFNRMRTDQGFDMEDRQIRSQSLVPREVMFMKFYEVPVNTQVDVVLVDGDQMLLRFNLNKLSDEKPVLVHDKKLILKYQKNFNLLVITSETFQRREDREMGDQFGQGDDDNMEENAKEKEEKRKEIARRRNPFNNKLTERDKMGFQQFHQDAIVSNLMNITTMNSANGKAVLEGIIRQGNVFFLRGKEDDLEKSDVKRQEWNNKLIMYHGVCRGFLQYKDIEAEIIMEELLQEDDDGEGRVEQRARMLENNQNQGKFSYNDYELSDIGFFEDTYKENVQYVLPNADINNKLLLALNPNFVLNLFNYQSKKVGNSNPELFTKKAVYPTRAAQGASLLHQIDGHDSRDDLLVRLPLSYRVLAPQGHVRHHHSEEVAGIHEKHPHHLQKVVC
jgi:hypothetical protein